MALDRNKLKQRLGIGYAMGGGVASVSRRGPGDYETDDEGFPALSGPPKESGTSPIAAPTEDEAADFSDPDFAGGSTDFDPDKLGYNAPIEEALDRQLDLFDDDTPQDAGRTSEEELEEAITEAQELDDLAEEPVEELQVDEPPIVDIPPIEPPPGQPITPGANPPANVPPTPIVPSSIPPVSVPSAPGTPPKKTKESEPGDTQGWVGRQIGSEITKSGANTLDLFGKLLGMTMGGAAKAFGNLGAVVNTGGTNRWGSYGSNAGKALEAIGGLGEMAGNAIGEIYGSIGKAQPIGQTMEELARQEEMESAQQRLIDRLRRYQLWADKHGVDINKPGFLHVLANMANTQGLYSAVANKRRTI